MDGSPWEGIAIPVFPRLARAGPVGSYWGVMSKWSHTRTPYPWAWSVPLLLLYKNKP